MREFQERRRLKEFLHSRYAIGFLILIIILLANAVWGISAKYAKSKEIAERAKADLETLKEREASLNRSIEALNTQEGKERELRDRFGVVKEGERMIVLIEEEVKSEPAAPPKKSWWARLWE
jgi:cell division protein FtsB